MLAGAFKIVKILIENEINREDTPQKEISSRNDSSKLIRIEQDLILKGKKNFHEFYRDNFEFYNLLNHSEKVNFQARVEILLDQKEFKVSESIEHELNDIKLFVIGAFVQITFGYRYFEMPKFSSIIVNEEYFYSKLVGAEVKGLTVGRGHIFYSWQDILKGFENESDKINLALHELAHAFYIQNFHGKIVREWEEWKWVAERELGYLRNYSEDNFFRPYAKTNLHEFWAVCVECFFEAPVEFKKRYDRLYSSTAKVLKQDMVKRKVKVQDKLA
jgi:Mlc titration factor MtfA (ptsG expression regulator)